MNRYHERNNINNNNNNLPYAYHPLGPNAVITRIHIQPVFVVFFFLQRAVPTFLPSNVLTDDISARYE